jgi:hypothetical protein
MQVIYTRAGVKTTELEPPENPIDPSGKNPLSVSQRGDGWAYPGVFWPGRHGVARRRTADAAADRNHRSSRQKTSMEAEEDAKRRQYLLQDEPAD